MAGQGITVSIQAKIEGWQNQIKQIQDAMKNIKPGSDMSKSLMKDLQQVENMVNNLGKNMTQRFTSDSQITHFVDKMMDVERILNHIGSSMQNVSFGDINPDYITNNFKDLLSTLEKANSALGTGMETSFQNAIADSKELQKEFEKMKIDPKSMNMDQVKEALTGRGQELAKDLQAAQKEAAKLKTEMQDAIQTREELIARGKDIKNTDTADLLGQALPQNGTIWSEKQIDAAYDHMLSKLISLGATKADLKLLPDIKDLMRESKWDQLPQEFNKILSRMGDNNQTNLGFARDAAANAVKAWRVQNGIVAGKEGTMNANLSAQETLNTQIAYAVEQATAPLRQEIAQLKAQLEGKATASIKETGLNVSNASAQGMQDAASAADQYAAALERVKAGEQMVGKIQGVIQRWFSVYAVVRMVTNSIKKAAKNIQELDSTMTEIAIVTKMDQGDLWAQMPKYTKMAREYASSIKGVYEVSQIYYQQGLQMNDVMSLTESTLKMARISGLDYSEAADYMTNAIRSFKMEMTDAERVVDVYSAVAASSASNVTELATAMSKTASSAQAVGSSFENTTAMLAVMIEATRESPENIGSAMKSIISRYGELKENKTGIDEEGEEYSLNKVDKALQTVGISIHDAKGEFRDFDDVIFELADHWDEIDKNTQRYIATVMAGNRQQSRFLALVSSSERLKEESAKATNSEDAAQLQFLKSLDSIDAKKQQLETSIQSIYTNSGIENVYKSILDFTNNILISFDNLSSSQGLGMAIAKIGATFMTLATLVTNAFKMIKSQMAINAAELTLQIKQENLNELEQQAEFNAQKQALREEDAANAALTEKQKNAILDKERANQQHKDLQAAMKKTRGRMVGGMVASAAGLAATTYAASLDVNKDRGLKAGMTALGGVLSGVGTGFMMGGTVGAIMGVLTALPSIVEAIGMASETTEEKVNRLEKSIEETNNERIKSKDDLNSLVAYKKKYDELYKSQYESAEKQKEFKELQNEIAEKYPSLITSMDAEGNYLVNMGNAYEQLTKAKRELYSTKFVENLGAELAGLQDIDYVLKNIYGVNPSKSKTFLGIDLDGMDKANQNFVKSFAEAKDHENELVPRTFVGTDTYGLPYYQYDSGFASFNASGLASLFLDDDASILSEGTDDSRATAKYLLAGLYNTYIKEAMKETAYEDINIEQTKQDLMTAAKTEFSGTYTDINANPEKYSDMLTEATTNFTADKYKAMMTTYQANEFSQTLRNNAIQASNADYIKTLNASYESALQNPLNSLTQFAMKKQLDQGLDKYLQENEYKVKKGEYYTDDKNVKRKYTTERLVSEFYSDKQGDWYLKQSQDYDFLNTDKLQAQYESLGSKTKKSIIENLSEDIGQTEADAYQKIDQWLAGNKDVLSGTDEQITQAIEQFQQDNNLTGLSTERIRQMATTLKVFQDAWDEQYEQIYKRYNSWADALGKSEKEGEKPQLSKTTAEKIQSFKDIFGPEYLQGIQDQYKTILKNASLSDSQREQQVQGLTDIFDLVASIETPEIKNAVLQKMQSADLTSINGIYSLIETLANIEDFDLETGKGLDLKNILKNFSKNLRVNVETEINSYFDTMESVAEGFDKALSSATGGMDLKAAKEMADKVGVSLKDFTIKDGKFFYDNLDKIQEAYTIDAQDRFTELKKNVTERYSTFLNSAGVAMGTVEEGVIYSSSIKNASKEVADLKAMSADYKKEFEAQTNIDYDEFVNYYEQYKKYYDEFNTEEGNPLSFVDWIAQNIDEQLADSVKAIEEWQKQTQALSQLKNGKIEGFLKTTGAWKTAWDYEGIIRDQNEAEQQAQKDNEELIQAIAQGDISNLPDNLKQFAKDIYDARHAVISNLTSSINDIIGGKDNQLFVDDTNIDLLQDLYDQGYLEDVIDTETQTRKDTLEKDDIVKLTQDVINGEQSLNSWIQEHYTNGADKLKALQEYNNLIHKNTIETTTNLMDQTSTVTFDEFTNYLNDIKGFDFNKDNVYQDNNEDFTAEFQAQLDKYGLEFNKATGRFFIKRQEQYLRGLKQDIDELGEDATLEERNAAEAKYDAGVQRITTLRTEALNTLFKDYDNISQTDLESIANAFGEDYSDLRDRITEENGLGGRKLSIKKVQSWLKTEQLTEDQIALYEGLIAGIADDYLDNISNAMTNVTKGVTKQADMQSFAEDYTKVTNEKIEAQELFKFDDVLQAFTLKPEYLQKYIQGQKQQLLEAGYTEDMVDSYIESQTVGAAAAAIDIQSYLQSDNQEGQIKEKTKQQLKNFQATISKREEDINSILFWSSDYEDYLNEGWDFDTVDENGEHILLIDWQKKRAEKLAIANQEFNEKWKDFQDKSDDDLLQLFKDGGEEAVKLASLMAEAQGKELTAEEMQQYYAPLAQKYSNMASQVAELAVGNYVGEGDLRNILSSVGAVDTSGKVIASVSQMASVYQEIYNKMSSGANATATQLNSVYAKMLTAQEQGDIDAISVMGDAMGMTYDALGEMFGKYGVELKDWLEQNTGIYEKIGAGKIRITDFTAFARTMKWDFNSEEYTSALKTYNDSLVELNTQIQKNIVEEFNQLNSAKTGDWLNFTYLTTELQKYSKKREKESKKNLEKAKSTYTFEQYGKELEEITENSFFNQVQKALISAGAYFDDGILKISKEANLFQIGEKLSEKIAEMASDPDVDLDILSDIQDTIVNIFKAYTDAISNGIKGSLTNSDSLDLIQYGKDLGVDNLDFTETAEGLKLSQQSAIRLYHALSQANGIKSKLVFDDLVSSLEEGNDQFADSTSLLTYMSQLISKINSLNSETDGAKLAQYEAELAVAKEIMAVRLNTDDQSWDFMSTDQVPSSIDNAIKYWQSWSTATKSLSEWAESGKIDYEQFASLAKHAIDLADREGRSLEFMGKKVGGQDGMHFEEVLEMIANIYKIDPETQKAYLSAEDMLNYGFDMKLGATGLSDELRASAKSFAALNQTQQANIHDFYSKLSSFKDEIDKEQLSFDSFVKDGVFDVDEIKNQSGKAYDAFMEFAKKVKIGQTSLYDTVKNGKNKFDKESQEYKIAESIFTMMNSEDWDISTGYQTIKEHLINTGFEGILDLGDIAFDVRGHHILTKPDGSKEEWYTEDGTKYTNVEDAWNDMNQKDLDQLKKDLGQYTHNSNKDGSNKVIIDGKEYTIEIKNGKVHVVQYDDQGNPVGEEEVFSTIEEMEATRYEEYASEVEAKNTQEGTTTKALSQDAWKLRNKYQQQTAAGKEIPSYQAGDQISADTRAALQKAGLTTQEAITEAWNEMQSAYGEDAVYEFEAQYGVHLTPGEVEIEDVSQSLADQASLRQEVVDIAEGVTAALQSNETKQAIGEAISDGLAESLKSEGTIEIEAPEIVIKPKSITVDVSNLKNVNIDNLPTQEVETEPSATETHSLPGPTKSDQEIEQIAAEKGITPPVTEEQHVELITDLKTPPNAAELLSAQIKPPIVQVENEVEELEPQEGEGTVKYENETEELPLLTAKGQIDWSNKYSIPTNLLATGEIHWTNIEDNPRPSNTEGDQEATGNIGLASGNARAKGTLMGELGPELVVSKGRYFVVGQSGPEMVDLADDAIVFNHLQTQSLLTKGTSSTRGRAITNERNAIAFATGSRWGGEAKDSIGTASQKTVVGSSDHGAWNGDHGGFDTPKTEDTGIAEATEEIKNFIDQLEIWFNWLQEIAQLEKEITLEEAKRTRYASDMVPHGQDYFTSQMASLESLKQQVEVQKDLNAQRKGYFENLREELNQGAFSILYEFDENFQPKYKQGAYEFMSQLLEADWYKTGEPNNDAETIYNKLVSMGFESMMKYDTSGNEIDTEKDGWQNSAISAFVERYKKGLEDGQSYHDEIMDGEQKVEELLDSENQILKDIEDNQIAVEQKVLKAVEESRQRAIDDAKDERDAIEESANTLIDGLNAQLDKERTMYQNQQSADELANLQRRLGILQRSGGSASEIADLQSQIQEKQYDKYFDTQEQQIQAIQDASDAELERLDNQIELMEETLAYEKEYGLLWNEVDEVLKGSAEDIVSFIQGNTAEYWSKSTTELGAALRTDTFEAQRFKEFQESVQGGLEALVAQFGGSAEDSESESEQEEASGEEAPASNGSTYAENVPGTWKQGDDGRWWYEHEDGTYTTNNWEKINDKWYHFDNEGWMQTGWLQDGDKWYYLDDTKGENEGSMVVGTRALEWNGKTQLHSFDSNGVWTGAQDINTGNTGNTGTYEWILKIGDKEYSFDNKTNAQKDYDTTVESYVAGLVEKGWTEADAKKSAKENITLNSKAVKKDPEKKAGGGYVDHGVYELGELGTETVFTASQTKVLRDNILSNRPESLINLLKSYNEAYRGLSSSTYDSITTNNPTEIIIERAEVNLQIDQLADDYDSKRAATTIMDEMLRIAAKTRVNNSIRR